eukprot:1120854-Pleurochrysis_carterae.AAC.1
MHALRAGGARGAGATVAAWGAKAGSRGSDARPPRENGLLGGAGGGAAATGAAFTRWARAHARECAREHT